MAKGTLHLNVEFSAVTDEEGKFARLATLLGLADADHARGKCEHLWLACTRRGESDLPQWLVEQVLGQGGPAALVDAELAGWAGGRGDSPTRRLVIGGARKHCLWMAADQAAKHEQSSKGGKARAASASRAGGRFTSPAGDNPPAQTSPSEIPSEIPSDQIPDPPPGRAIPPTAVPAAPPADTETRDREARRRVALEIRAELERARGDVATELQVEDHGLLAQDPGERDLAAHLVAAGPSGLAAAREQALHAIAMAALEARRDSSLQWLTGAIFAERQFRRLVAMTAADAAAPRKGARAATAIRATPEQIASARYVLERLSADSGVAWRVEDGHHARIVELLSEHTAIELRAVATWCGDEWKSDEKMARHLTPDTVFGPKFPTYLAQALARYGDQITAQGATR